MNVPKVDIKQLLEAGVHLGHKTLRWNPKMRKYIFGEKNSIHIIDLTQTVDFIKNALVQVHKVIASGGKLLVVSTKKQASEQISELAKETGQYFVNYRWLGGMLTNWNTIQNSIKRLKKLLSEEFKSIGFYLTNHPLNEFEDIFEQLKIKSFNQFYKDNLDEG